jgi:HK97 family phage portal protein
MGAIIQDLWQKYVWNSSKRSSGYDLATINGSILQSILDSTDFTDENVTVKSGLRLDPVFTCVNVIQQTLGALPGNVIQEQGGNKVKLTDHPVYYPLAHEPNNYMSAANFWMTLGLHFSAWGNGYARINRDSRRNPVSYDIMEPWEVSITHSDGDLWYHYMGETISSWDVLHFRLFSLDGICGESPITWNKNLMGKAMKLERFSALAVGDQPPGVLSYNGTMNPTQMEMSKKAWQEGPKGSVRVMPADWKYQAILSPADQAQYIQTWESTERRIYGVWRIPPTFAQNFQRATFSNAEQSDLVFSKHTVTPICTMIEKEVNMKCFFEREKDTTGWKFNMNGLLRGDLAARQAFFNSMVNNGIMMRNEARDLEDLNPYEGGGVPLVQGAMVPADQEGIDALRKKMETEVIPSADPTQRKNYVNGHTYSN